MHFDYILLNYQKIFIIQYSSSYSIEEMISLIQNHFPRHNSQPKEIKNHNIHFSAVLNSNSPDLCACFHQIKGSTLSMKNHKFTHNARQNELNNKNKINKQLNYKSYAKQLNEEHCNKSNKKENRHIFKIKTFNNQKPITELISFSHNQSNSDSKTIHNTYLSSVHSYINSLQLSKVCKNDKKSQSSVRRITKKMSAIQLRNEISQQKSFELNKSIFEECQQIFNERLKLYRISIQSNCKSQGIKFQVVNSYPKSMITYSLDRNYDEKDNQNENDLIQQVLVSRWWLYQQQSEISQLQMKTKMGQANFYWTNGPIDQNVSLNKQQISTNSSLYSTSFSGQLNDELNQQMVLQKIRKQVINNHFKNNKLMQHLMLQQDRLMSQDIQTYIVGSFQDRQWKSFVQSYLKQQAKGHFASENKWKLTSSKDQQWCFKLREIQTIVNVNIKRKQATVIQKYHSLPFVIREKEVKVSAFLLVTNLNQNIRAYLFNDGIIQLARGQRQLLETTTRKTLRQSRFKQIKTNRAHVQDIMDFQTFKFALQLNQTDKYDFNAAVMTKIQEIATSIVQKSVQYLMQDQTSPCFQAFQLQFGVNHQFHPYLTQIKNNTIQASQNNVVNKIMRQVLDCSFRMTIDLFFPPPLNWPSSKKYFLPHQSSQTIFKIIYGNVPKAGQFKDNCMNQQTTQNTQMNTNKQMVYVQSCKPSERLLSTKNSLFDRLI